MEKEKIHENSLIYLNQGYQTSKDNKKVYYGDFFILGQVNEALNPPEDLSTCKFKDREVKLFCPRYDPITGTFLGLYMRHLDISWSEVMPMSISFTIDIQRRTLKFLTLSRESVCQTASRGLSIIDIEYNLNLEHYKLIFLKYFISFLV